MESLDPPKTPSSPDKIISTTNSHFALGVPLTTYASDKAVFARDNSLLERTISRKSSKNNIFSKKFFWGASTSGHQVEGGAVNQWSVWELANASESAKTAGDKFPMASHSFKLKQLPIWQKHKSVIKDPNNYISGNGIEHYKRYKEDFNLIEELNLNSFRFSIEWSRIEPQEGQWDISALKHYRDYIKELNKRNIEPFINLWHFSLPIWFADLGGFENTANLKYWNRFVELVSNELLKDIKYVITINEPNVYASFGYLIGEHPPGKHNPLLFSKVYWNLTKAHRQAYDIIKSKHPHIQIGIATQLANIQAKRPHNLFDNIATQWMRYFWNWWFILRTRKQQDFIGFNYYFTDYYKFENVAKAVDPKVPLSDLGWYMEPEGLYPLLLRIWSRYKKPIIITENGLADGDDSYRRWWIEESIIAMERAISEGVDLRGYFHWSLLDNFEWSYGWWPKFGLVAVDRQNNMKRTIRPSAKWFAQRIAEIRNNN